MQYFKHSELANQYHVSLKTVHNWIGAAKENKLALELHEAKSGTYVANTANNAQLLESLAAKGKKYRNTLHRKVVYPRQEFYEIYTRRQILDIINNIDIHREIPGQYNYLEEGARNWDSWMQRLASDTTANVLNGTISLLRTHMITLDNIIAPGTRVNIIDLGVGNAYPVKELLGHLLDKEVLHRYIGIDISPSMLDIARSNIHKWYGDEVRFEGYVRDMTYERFDDLVVDDMLDDRADQTINLVLLLGGTAANFPSYSGAIKTISDSLGRNDLLLYIDKLDTEASRKYFDFSIDKDSESDKKTSKLSEGDGYILDLLGITEDLYEVESGYNQQKHMRYIQVRLNRAITIELNIGKGAQHLHLERGDTILILRILHHTAYEIVSTFEKAGLALRHVNISPDKQFFFSISSLEQKQVDE